MSMRQEEPLNAFRDDYLNAVKLHDEPSTSFEADTAGPFSLIEQRGMLALFRSWESSEKGDVPLALFRQRETALLFQAIWPAVGRSRLFNLRTTPTAHGFELEQEGQPVGSLQTFNPEAVLGGHFVSYLTRNPWSMALLVEACGPNAQRHVGQILGARLLER
jgi:hypothetical protein